MKAELPGNVDLGIISCTVERGAMVARSVRRVTARELRRPTLVRHKAACLRSLT